MAISLIDGVTNPDSQNKGFAQEIAAFCLNNISFNRWGILEGIIGLGLGLQVQRIICTPLTEKIIKILGVARIHACRVQEQESKHLGGKVLLFFLAGVLGPILEEQVFRGSLQEAMKRNLRPFYENRGLPKPIVNTAACVTSIFSTSITFGLVHFINVLEYRCHPVLFLRQAIGATIFGFICSLTKEFSGKMNIPIGLHVGNNALVAYQIEWGA